jgi:Resolvase, N terminal domain
MHPSRLAIILVPAQAGHRANLVRVQEFFRWIKSCAIVSFAMELQRVVDELEIIRGVNFQSRPKGEFDQDLAGQLAELESFGCERSYHEKESGARSDRPQLRKAISRLTQGDVLVVCRLDRLARSTRDLLNVLAQVSEQGAGFKSLKDAWADTTTPHGRLMLTVLGGLAEFERELIRARTGEGRKRDARSDAFTFSSSEVKSSRPSC